MASFSPKYSIEVLDYVVDWTNRLGDDTINSVDVIIIKGNVTADRAAPDPSGTKAVFWLSGGTPGESCTLRVEVETQGLRTMSVDVGIRIQ